MFLVAIYISTQIRKRGGVEKDFSHLKCINSVSLETNTSQLEALVDNGRVFHQHLQKMLVFPIIVF